MFSVGNNFNKVSAFVYGNHTYLTKLFYNLLNKKQRLLLLQIIWYLSDERRIFLVFEI
jgi:hypothetical protein